jgi:hypothetical protein
VSNVTHLLPKLTVNRQFINDFLAATSPCFALGMIEERQKKLGLLALRPGEIISHEVTEPGFNFGHSLLGNDRCEVVHFAFEFYGFGTYNVLLNPNNPVVQAVFNIMIENGEYFFLAIMPDHGVTTFRSEIGEDSLTGLTDNLARIQNSTTNDMQYQKALRQFQEHPTPPGRQLTWVCRDNMAYIDLSTDRLELTPRAGSAPPNDGSERVAEQRFIAGQLNGKMLDMLQTGVDDDLTLLTRMAPDMHLFKRLLDISGKDGVSDLFIAYPGLYRFAKLLELLATRIQSGDITVTR